MWPDRRLIDFFGIEHPIVQAPMAGVMDAELVIAVAEARRPRVAASAMLTAERARERCGIIRQRDRKPINMNFFCHRPTESEAEEQARWRERLGAYYSEFGVDPAKPVQRRQSRRRSTRPCARSSRS